MKNGREMKNEMMNLYLELNKQRREDLQNIIDRLWEHPIARKDIHYQFLKNIEASLREYQKNYNL